MIILTILGALSFIPSSLGGIGERYPKDLTGHYHGEGAHHHAHVHSDDTNAGSNSTTTIEGNHIGGSHVHPAHIPTPVAPHCLCVVRSTGCLGREEYTRQFDGISTLVCGLSYERCCFEDPWPGVVDQWADKAPCVPQEVCPRWYGQAATDVSDFGVMGPCPGFGAVRCINQIAGHEHDVTPIVDVPPPPVTNVQTVVVPIIPEPPPPFVYELPSPPPSHPVVLPPPVVYNVPEYETPVVIPPSPQTIEVPTPVPETNEVPPPPPSNTYEPPVATYEPPQVNTPGPLPAYSRPGPPYLWRNLAVPYSGYGYGLGGWPYFGKSFRKRIGFGFGLVG
jgi:hypothetical protein